MLGFLDLQLGQAQATFFRNLEDWLSGANKAQPTTPYLDGDQAAQPVVAADGRLHGETSGPAAIVAFEVPSGQLDHEPVNPDALEAGKLTHRLITGRIDMQRAAAVERADLF